MKGLKHTVFFIFLVSTLLLQKLQAQTNSSLDKSSQEALHKTMQLLQNPSQRNQAIQKNKDAINNHKAIESLTGGDASKTNDIYKLSSDIFNSLVQQTGGDVNKLQKLLEQAQKNPEAFAQSLTDEQKKKLKEISSGIESSRSQKRH